MLWYEGGVLIMMDDGNGGVVVLWWCGFGEGSAFECGSGVTNGRMEHLFLFVSRFLQNKIADSHEFFWSLQRGLCTKAQSILWSLLQVVIYIVEQFEELCCFFRPVAVKSFLSGWYLRASCL